MKRKKGLCTEQDVGSIVMQYLIRTNIFQAEELPLTETIYLWEHREGINPSPLASGYQDVPNISGCVSKAENTEPETILKKPFLPILSTQKCSSGPCLEQLQLENPSAKCCRDQSLPCTHRFLKSKSNLWLCSSSLPGRSQTSPEFQVGRGSAGLFWEEIAAGGNYLYPKLVLKWLFMKKTPTKQHKQIHYNLPLLKLLGLTVQRVGVRKCSNWRISDKTIFGCKSWIKTRP